ncbi:hypothetical protein BD289DRAFT_185409 [Coniella lustricola]|uniref:Uncharacterized protein n=1 Tax=Coniella lustricola TaxID=2025994 RepID=A0A2T2ZT42_9PEZI|nr:hypothetical protein BD289DRAFT_185409 [Coniella lustricola]
MRSPASLVSWLAYTMYLAPVHLEASLARDLFGIMASNTVVLFRRRMAISLDDAGCSCCASTRWLPRFDGLVPANMMIGETCGRLSDRNKLSSTLLRSLLGRQRGHPCPTAKTIILVSQ